MKTIVNIPDYLYEHLNEIIRGSMHSVLILDYVKQGTPLPKGHWIDDMSLGYHVSICSNCDWRGHGDTCLIYKPKYCPNCGADMREVKE